MTNFRRPDFLKFASIEFDPLHMTAVFILFVGEQEVVVGVGFGCRWLQIAWPDKAEDESISCSLDNRSIFVIDCWSIIWTVKANGADGQEHEFRADHVISSAAIAELGETSFTIWITPHTFAVTNLPHKSAGDAVNLEFDMLAKYMERFGQTSA